MHISLVIPVRDEASSVVRLLDSIAQQTKMPDEVIFVDAGSTDGTKTLIESRADIKTPVKVISVGPAYPGTARNAGVEAARYDVIAFTDAGITLDRNWLYELSDTMLRGAVIDVVYGGFSPRADTFFKRCYAMAVVPPAPSNAAAIRTPFIASSLLKRSVWATVGGFPDYRAAEDRIFMERIAHAHFTVRCNPRARVVWDVPGDLGGVFSRFMLYSYHDLVAGRPRDWHLPVMRMYLASFLCIGLAFVVASFFIAIPFFGLMLRAGRKVWINRREGYCHPGSLPAYFCMTGFLIVFIDCAMFAGWFRYLFDRKITHA